MIRLEELLEATGARTQPGSQRDAVYSGFAYDPLGACDGRVFVAVPTENGDGQESIARALSRGAAAVLCEQAPPDLAAGVPVLEVPDVLGALSDWARLVVGTWRPSVVAVTGGLGKSITKELLASMLRQRFRVTRAADNQSGRLGLPVALAEMDREAEVAVLELAVDGLGQMRALCDMAPPDLTVVTGICERGQECFASPKDLAAEIGCAVASARLAALNQDDERSWRLRERSEGVLGFGLESGDLRAEDVRLDKDGMALRLVYRGEAVPCRVRLHAPALVYDCLAAVAAALQLGLSLEEAAAGLQHYTPLPGRMNPLPGRSGAVVLDDSYGGCPASALAGLAGLGAYPASGRRHAVLGDLDGWDPAHVLLLAAEVRRSADAFWALGDHGAAIAQALPGMDAQVFYSCREMTQALDEELGPGDVVLVHGGRRARLERAVAALVEPSHRGQVVRQGPQWDSARVVWPDRPTWAELDMEALASNTRLLREISGVPVMAVLKGDAYGHGAARVARVVLRSGAEALAVACLPEARALRRAGIEEAEILILGYNPAWLAREAVRNRVSCALYGWEEARALAQAGADLGMRPVVHVKVDTGMGRLGLDPEDVPEFLERLADQGALEVRGIFTHFGSADSADLSYCYWQLERFLRLLDTLEAKGLRPPVAHAANTAAAVGVPEARLDMVRPGIGLYGLDPSPEAPLPPGFRPVLSLKTTVAQVKTVPRGTYVGYGQACYVDREITVAVIPVGYADGFRRSPRNWGHVLVRGQRCPVLGNVCMDQAMVDVSAVPGVCKGDEVVLIGRQGDATIEAEDVAASMGTIPYEVVSEILARVPRMV